MTREISNNPLERYFARNQMTKEERKALIDFEEIIQEELYKLSKIITYNELVEYFEDTKIIDLW